MSALGNLSACVPVLALMCGLVYMCVTSTWPKKIHVYTLAPSFFLLLIITISLLQPCIIGICNFKLSARGKLSACVLGQCVDYWYMRPKGICACPFFLSSFAQKQLPSRPLCSRIIWTCHFVCFGQMLCMFWADVCGTST